MHKCTLRTSICILVLHGDDISFQIHHTSNKVRKENCDHTPQQVMGKGTNVKPKTEVTGLFGFSLGREFPLIEL